MRFSASILVLVAAATGITEALPHASPDLSPFAIAAISIVNPIAGVAVGGTQIAKSRETSGRITDQGTLNSVGTTLEEQEKCLKEYKDFGWTGNVCGNRGWYMKGLSWNDPADCYDSCYNATLGMIQTNNAAGECATGAGTARCWMGYHDPNLS